MKTADFLWGSCLFAFHSQTGGCRC